MPWCGVVVLAVGSLDSPEGVTMNHPGKVTLMMCLKELQRMINDSSEEEGGVILWIHLKESSRTDRPDLLLTHTNTRSSTRLFEFRARTERAAALHRPLVVMCRTYNRVLATKKRIKNKQTVICKQDIYNDSNV